MKFLERFRMSLSLTPFEKRMIFLFFLMVISGNFYNSIRIKIKENLKEEDAMLFEEDEITKININSAPLESLILLPGIGEKTARLIIEMREKEKFSKPEDLLKVKGIGFKKIERLKPYILFK